MPEAAEGRIGEAAEGRIGEAAEPSDSTTYIPDRPCRRGHMLRYRTGTCVECHRATVKRNYNPEARMDRSLQSLYGINLPEYNRLLETQGGGCAICRSKEPGGKGRFHVDHCHTTQVVRGLLCHGCNIGIGCLRDDPDLLVRAADYLRTRT